MADSHMDVERMVMQTHYELSLITSSVERLIMFVNVWFVLLLIYVRTLVDFVV